MAANIKDATEENYNGTTDNTLKTSVHQKVSPKGEGQNQDTSKTRDYSVKELFHVVH